MCIRDRFTHSREGIAITDRKGTILAVNDSFTRITGRTAEDALGRSANILRSHEQKPEFYQAMIEQLQRTDYWSGELWNQRKNGERFVEALTVTAVRESEGRLLHYVAMFADNTQQRESARLLAHAAHYDAQTGLPNRTLLADRLMQAMRQCDRRQCDLAVVYLDLDGFGAYNEHMGHERGLSLIHI